MCVCERVSGVDARQLDAVSSCGSGDKVSHGSNLVPELNRTASLY